MSGLHLIVEGDDAATVAAELEAWVHSELGTAAPARPLTDSLASDGEDEVMRSDPVAIAALVISIPGGILSVLDLAKRIDLIPKLRKLLALVSARRARVKLRTRQGELPLPGATADQVVQALADAEAEAAARDDDR